jgi:hypothetical protein
MKTSKVKEIKKVSEYNGQNGLTYYHNLIMDNGDKLNIGKKAKLNTGDELTYELTGGSDDQQEYKKAKSVKPQFNQSGYTHKYEPKDTNVITMLSCISSACNAVSGSSKCSDKGFILDMAESFYSAAMSKSKNEPVNNEDKSNDDLPF